MDRTPGSFVEEKKYALVWHYRMADPEFGEWLANELVSMLEAMLAETELRAFRGEKVVEVKPAWANKGEVLERLLAACSDTDFTFVAGDDRTDEDLFERMKAEAWTVHIARGLLAPHLLLRILRACAGYWRCLAKPETPARHLDSWLS